MANNFTFKNPFEDEELEQPNFQITPQELLQNGLDNSEQLSVDNSQSTPLSTQDLYKSLIEKQIASEGESPSFNWRAALASLGAGIAGRDPGAAGMAIVNQDAAAEKSNKDLIMQYLKNKLDSEKTLALNKAKIAQAGQRQDNFDRSFNQRERQIAAQIETAAAIRGEKAAEKQAVKEEKQELLNTPYGQARTADDAKQLKAAGEAKQSFDTMLDELISLRKKHQGGAILNREDVGRSKQLSKDLLLKYKDLSKLGVLSAMDTKILNDIIPDDPLQYNSPLAALQGQDPTLYKLEKFKEDKNKEFEAKVNNRVRGIQPQAQPQAAAPKTNKLPIGSIVKSGGKRFRIIDDAQNLEEIK